MNTRRSSQERKDERAISFGNMKGVWKGQINWEMLYSNSSVGKSDCLSKLLTYLTFSTLQQNKFLDNQAMKELRWSKILYCDNKIKLRNN